MSWGAPVYLLHTNDNGVFTAHGIEPRTLLLTRSGRIHALLPCPRRHCIMIAGDGPRQIPGRNSRNAHRDPAGRDNVRGMIRSSQAPSLPFAGVKRAGSPEDNPGFDHHLTGSPAESFDNWLLVEQHLGSLLSTVRPRGSRSGIIRQHPSFPHIMRDRDSPRIHVSDWRVFLRTEPFYGHPCYRRSRDSS